MAARSYIRKVGMNGVYNESDEFMAGQIVYCAGTNIPSGYLECNGATVSRTTYATLFAAIGATYGVGDGASTFRLPDLRGEFLRGADRGRGVDSGRVVGSLQADEIKNHAHPVGRTSTAGGGFPAIVGVGEGAPVDRWTGNAGGGETRPRNVALIPCIKYS